MIRKLMLATSVAAMTAGTANAVVLLRQADTVFVPATEITAAAVLANEVTLTSTTGLGTFGLQLSTSGIIPPGQNVFVTIEVTGGTFTETLTGAEVVAGTTGATVNNQTLTSVRYLLTTDGASTLPGSLPTGQADQIQFAIPLTAASCGSGLNFTVTEFRTEGTPGTPIENGNVAANLPAPAITCVSAYTATARPDTNLSRLDVRAAPGFSDFVASGAGAVADTVNNAVLGIYDLVVNTAARRRLDTATFAAPGDVSGFTTTIGFASGTSSTITSCDLDGIAGTFFATTAVALTAGNTCTITSATPAALTNEQGSFEVNIAALSVAAQVVSVNSALINFGASLGLPASEAFVAAAAPLPTNMLSVGAVDVEDLVYNGQWFGPFDWVGDGTLPTNNVFRVTGLPSSGTIQGQLVLENSSVGQNGTFLFTLPSATVPVVNGEAIINASRMTTIAGGNFGRADASLVFSTSNTLDVDRLMSSAAGSAVVSSYGDNANSGGVSGLPLIVAPPATTQDDVSNN